MTDRKLFVLTHKLEYMCLALGGEPDKEVQSNIDMIDEYEKESKSVLKYLKDCKKYILSDQGKTRKDRVLAREKINK